MQLSPDFLYYIFLTGVSLFHVCPAQVRVTLVDVSGTRAEEPASSSYLDHVQYDARFEDLHRASPRLQHTKSATTPLAPLTGSALARQISFDPFSPLSSPRPTRLAHPTHIQMPTSTFTPPPHSFVDTLTPRGHYSSSSFRLRPGVTGESETETVATAVSSPETYVEEAGGESSPEGSIGKWFQRRRSDVSIRISAPDSSYVEKTGRARDGAEDKSAEDKSARARGRTAVDDLAKRVHDLAVEEPNGTFVRPPTGTEHAPSRSADRPRSSAALRSRLTLCWARPSRTRSSRASRHATRPSVGPGVLAVQMTFAPSLQLTCTLVSL